jgi:hypothetical protein
MESSCVIVALIENYSTSKPLNVSPEKSYILSCDTLVAKSDIGIVDCKKRSSKTHQRICYGEEFSEYVELVNSCCCSHLKGQAGVCDLRKGACKLWQTVTQNCA